MSIDRQSLNPKQSILTSPCFQGEFVPVIGFADAAMQPPKGSSDPDVPRKPTDSEGLTGLPPSQDSSGNSKESSALSVTTDRNTCVAR
jgi:hypothetical protein